MSNGIAPGNTGDEKEPGQGAAREVVLPAPEESLPTNSSDDQTKPTTNGQCQCSCHQIEEEGFWEKYGDRILLWTALPIILFTIFVACQPTEEGQDQFARMNILLLGLLAISWLIGLCSKIKVRAWATGLALAGLAMWIMAVLLGAGGEIKALGDVFRY